MLFAGTLPADYSHLAGLSLLHVTGQLTDTLPAAYSTLTDLSRYVTGGSRLRMHVWLQAWSQVVLKVLLVAATGMCWL